MPGAAHDPGRAGDILVPAKAAMISVVARWLVVGALLVSVPAFGQQAFFKAVADLPLMPGLVEMPESALVFDNPGGRIIDVSVTGTVSVEEVLAFYEETLPQLGWDLLREGSFVREGEQLKVIAETMSDGVAVRFSITPRITPAP